MIHGVHHVGLLISDLERSLKFYRDVLGANSVASSLLSKTAGLLKRTCVTF